MTIKYNDSVFGPFARKDVTGQLVKFQWGVLVRDIWEFLVLFLHLICKFENITNKK